MAKVKRYAEGDMVEDSFSRETEPGSATPNIPEKTVSSEKTINYGGNKPKVVTKEELEKSGLTLREYMNKQQGLKARGESASTTTKASAPSTPTAPTSKETSTSTAPIDETKLSLAERAALTRNKARSGTTTDTRPVNQRIREALGFKKGGMTKSSASSRADGCCVKGKTRGKMV
jgi:hypothetical protein